MLSTGALLIIAMGPVAAYLAGVILFSGVRVVASHFH